MPLARVTTWVAGNTLTAAALNGEFNNILNNPTSLVSTFLPAPSAQGDILIAASSGSDWVRFAVGTTAQALLGGTTGPIWLPYGRTIIPFSRGVNVTSSATVYTALALSSTTETTTPGVQIPYPAGRASRLFVNISSSGASTGTLTVFLRRDAVNTGITVTISSSETSASDVSNTATMTSTNVLTLSWAVTTGVVAAVGNASLLVTEIVV